MVRDSETLWPKPGRNRVRESAMENAKPQGKAELDSCLWAGSTASQRTREPGQALCAMTTRD